MNPKILILVGAISATSYIFSLVPTFQESLIQGILLAIFALIILTIVLFFGYKNRTTLNACQSLCNVLINLLSYTILFNAICILISHDSLWSVSLFQSIFFPIILSGFIGSYTQQKCFRHCSTAALVISVVCCCYSSDISDMIHLAILTNVICLVIPASIEYARQSPQEPMGL